MKLRKKKYLFVFTVLVVFHVLAFGGLFLKTILASGQTIKIRYDKEKIENLFVGDSYKVKITGTKEKVKWKSSDKSIAVVNKKGKVTGKKPGKVKIIISVKNVKFSLDFVIVKQPEEVEKTEKEKEIMEKMKELKKVYKQGMSWGNEKMYFCDSISTEGHGCAALAFRMSDELFGKETPLVQIDDFTNIEEEIRVGDIIRVDGDSHSILVIDRDSEGVIMVQGNFTLYDQKDIIHWGERMSYQKLREIGNYYHTRYPR